MLTVLAKNNTVGTAYCKKIIKFFNKSIEHYSKFFLGEIYKENKVKQ